MFSRSMAHNTCMETLIMFHEMALKWNQLQSEMIIRTSFHSSKSQFYATYLLHISLPTGLGVLRNFIGCWDVVDVAIGLAILLVLARVHLSCKVAKRVLVAAQNVRVLFLGIFD